MRWILFNSELMSAAEPCFLFNDLAIQRGYGVFDFFRLNQHKPLFIDEHLNRLFFSAAQMRLNIDLSKQQLKEHVEELISKNNFPNSGVRITITGGYSEDNLSIGKPNVVISQHSFTVPTLAQREKGMKLVTYDHQRQLPHVKTIDYTMSIWLKPWLEQSNADDLLYHQNGAITESPRSNFFIVTNEDKIATAGENILKGITRSKVIQLAKEHFEVEERPIQLQELLSAREAFITSTTKEILPVLQVDDHIFPERKVTAKLQQLFTEFVRAQ